jgi:outer membrane protein assembly factor BamD (BamD/ComL family)
MNTYNDDDPKLKVIAEKILSLVPNAPENFGSVIAVLMMISIILTVIRVLQECNKNKTKNMTNAVKSSLYSQEIKSLSKKRGWLTRLRIKKIVRQHLNTEDYNKYGIKIVEALMDAGENITEDEASTLVEAANV